MIKPKRLRRGDVIGIVAPSSPEKFSGRVEKGVRYLESCGYRVEVGTYVDQRNGYLAGTDLQRAEDLNAMFANKHVKAIMCTRGGYGAARILPMLHWGMIKRNPKIFVGFSDGTALNLALLAKSKLISFTGALPGVDFWKDKIDNFTEEHFWRALTSTKPLPKIPIEQLFRHNNTKEKKAKSQKPKATEGVLVGGNLSIVASLTGTKYIPKLNSPLWLLEEVHEEPYRVDRMLTQLRLAGLFNRAVGVVFGEFTHCEPEDVHSTRVETVLDEYASSIAAPTFRGLQYGHVAKKLTLPIGASASLDTARGVLRITEAGVI